MGQWEEVPAAVLTSQKSWAILKKLQSGVGWNRSVWATCASPTLYHLDVSITFRKPICFLCYIWRCMSLFLQYSDWRNTLISRTISKSHYVFRVSVYFACRIIFCYQRMYCGDKLFSVSSIEGDMSAFPSAMGGLL